MRKTIRYIGIGSVIFAVPMVFIGALMKIESWEYASFFLTAGVLASTIPICIIVILLINKLAGKDYND